MKRLINSIVLFAALLFSGLVMAAPSVKNVKAVLYLCNPLKNDYCAQSEVNREGFGLITFKDGDKGESFSIRPGGKTTIDAAIMTGALQAYSVTQWEKHKSEKFFYTNEILVSGYFGVDPITKSEVVFYITAMEELE